MKPSRIAAIFIIAICILSGAVCAQSDATGEPRHIVIGFTSGYNNNPFQKEFLSYAQAECSTEGIELVARDGNNDIARQSSIIQQWARGGVDAVICSPINPAAIQASLDSLMQAGIPVINIDSECERSTVYVGFDQFEYGYTAGKIAADWINENLGDMDTVACAVLTKPQSLALIERENGIISALSECCDNTVIVDMPVYTDQQSAYEATKTLLAQHSDIRCIVGVADVSILGAHYAVTDMGLDTRDMCLVGLDATQELLELMRQGTAIRGTASLNTQLYAQKAVQAALKAIRGEEVERRIIVEIEPVSIDNLHEFLHQ
ncbi:MAG: sugar ABC transporter substrate-binding protein [Clostridia bacterium]|nr:sugar ABC transporter substrate-binding protein [Clostridia bacterium]